MPRQKSQPGFTLLELMVSIAVGLIVMATMASLFKTRKIRGTIETPATA